MADKNANQVIVNGETILDLTADTITADKLVKGITAHDASGSQIIGTLVVSAASDNNVEAYEIDPTNPVVSFKTDGTIKVFGYGYTTSSSSWGGSSTTVHAFCGDGYYKAATWGSPSKTSCTFAVSDGKLTGLPTLNGGTLLAVCGL